MKLVADFHVYVTLIWVHYFVYSAVTFVVAAAADVAAANAAAASCRHNALRSSALRSTLLWAHWLTRASSLMRCTTVRSPLVERRFAIRPTCRVTSYIAAF